MGKGRGYMQAFLRKFEAWLPAAREELAEFQVLRKQLDRVERLARKGKLDEKALVAIYNAMPRAFVLRAGRPSNDREVLPKTTKVLAELNRVIKVARSTPPGKG